MFKKTLALFKPMIAPQTSKMPTYFNLSNQFFYQPKRFYAGDEIILRDTKNGYFQDPEEVTRRLCKLIALHDKCRDPSKITLGSTFYDLGLNDLDVVEILFEAENEFQLEIPDEDAEKMRTVEDAVEYISRSFFAM